MSITAQYHIRLDFVYPEGDPAVGDDIDGKLFALIQGTNMQDLNVFSGNAACDPYLTCWSDLMEDAVFAEDKIIDLLIEQGCTVKGLRQ